MDRKEAQRASAVPVTATQGAEARNWSWVEPSVWTERMVSALENGVKGGRWYSLMDKVMAPATLEAAWDKVQANGGAAGVDPAGRDPEGRGQDATAGHTDGQGSHRPDGGEVCAGTDLRSQVPADELRLSAATGLPGCVARSGSTDRGRPHVCG